MKKIFPITLVILTMACNSSAPKVDATAPETPVSSSAHEYSVKARYSSNWEIGDAALAEKVINFWKHFDNNTLDSVRGDFADSVYMEMAGFSGMVHGDTALAHAKADRAGFSSIRSEIDAIIPVNPKDHPDEKIVTIWGEEIGVYNGKEIQRKVHETWTFNKDGKLIWMLRFIGYNAK